MPWQDPIVARLAADEAESCCLPNPPLLSLLVFVWAIGHGWRLHEVRPVGLKKPVGPVPVSGG